MRKRTDKRTMIPVTYTVTCPKGFLTQQRGIWAWGRLSKKNQLITDVQQCPLCSKWHLGTAEQIVKRENLIKKLADLRKQRREKTDKLESFEKYLKQPVLKRIVHGQPIGTIVGTVATLILSLVRLPIPPLSHKLNISVETRQAAVRRSILVTKFRFEAMPVATSHT